MVNNSGICRQWTFNGAVGAFSLNGNVSGFSNNAMGDSASQGKSSSLSEYSRW